MADQHNPIERFNGNYRFLSNFYALPVPIELYGNRFVTSEHAYQWWKIDPADTRSIQALLATPLPGAAKRIAARARQRADWSNIRLAAMGHVLRLKFADPGLRYLLLATDERMLIEGNTWNDNFWGVCNGWGENHLGQLLMEVRAEIRKQQ